MREAAEDLGAEWLAADVTDPDCAARIVATAREQLGRLDVLVNNAGTSRNVALDELTDEDWREQHELHVMAPMRLMRLAAPLMAERGWGRIVNVASSSGKRPSASNAAYSVAKAGQLSVSRAFADAYASRGVLVNAVAPGPVSSPLWTGEGGLADQVAAAAGSRARRRWRRPRRRSRAGASARRRRSPTWWSSCARSAPATSRARRGRLTAAPSTSSSSVGRGPLHEDLDRPAGAEALALATACAARRSISAP